MKNFDLFRLNCFLDDSKAVNYKNIIVSLVSEYIYDNNNEGIDIEKCFLHIINYHKISIDRDVFDSIIDKSNNFDKNILDQNTLLSLKEDKFNKIDDDINSHSIDIYIRDFITLKKYDEKNIDTIKSLLYQAVYENINTFSTENLSSLISEKVKEDFRIKDIDLFNEFLEYENHSKNSAIYNIFLKAVEYAIITSGRGVSEFSKDIFKGKKYLLDTNVIFRLLGIGGEERKKITYDLIKICNEQGIEFEYTNETFFEFLKKVSGTIKFLEKAERELDIKALGYVVEQDIDLVREDFVSHYSRLRLSKKIKTPTQYEISIKSEWEKIRTELNIKIADTKNFYKDKKVQKLSKEFLENKKKLPYDLKYTEKAAKVDAYNIFYVRKLRGSNNYNYNDVKSFYLTTDRSLNKILSSENSNIIPETILPSQLFLIHFQDISNENKDIDYSFFLKFVRRRTTGYQLRGSQVLTYINNIR